MTDEPVRFYLRVPLRHLSADNPNLEEMKRSLCYTAQHRGMIESYAQSPYDEVTIDEVKA